MIEKKFFDGLSVRRYYFKEGFIDITHSRPKDMDQDYIEKTSKTEKVITYAKLGRFGKWVDTSFLNPSPVSCHSFAEIFTADEVWSKIYR